MVRFDYLQLDCNDHLYIHDGAHAIDGKYKVSRRLNNPHFGTQTIMSDEIIMVGCWDLPRRYQWLAALEAGHVMFFYWIDRRDCLLIRSDAVCPTVFITTGVVGLIIQTEAERRRREAGVKQSMEIRLGSCMWVGGYVWYLELSREPKHVAQ